MMYSQPHCKSCCGRTILCHGRTILFHSRTSPSKIVLFHDRTVLPRGRTVLLHCRTSHVRPVLFFNGTVFFHGRTVLSASRTSHGWTCHPGQFCPVAGQPLVGWFYPIVVQGPVVECVWLLDMLTDFCSSFRLLAEKHGVDIPRSQVSVKLFMIVSLVFCLTVCAKRHSPYKSVRPNCLTTFYGMFKQWLAVERRCLVGGYNAPC